MNMLFIRVTINYPGLICISHFLKILSGHCLNHLRRRIYFIVGKTDNGMKNRIFDPGRASCRDIHKVLGKFNRSIANNILRMA